MTGLPEPELITAEPPRRVRRAAMAMDWRVLTAIHWRIDPSVMAARLPDGLRPDTFDGSAWVGLIPFQMRDVRFPVMPRGIPWIGTFPETNVRTYVVGPDGRRGIWFDSLDITRGAAVAVARAGYQLPYHWGSMSIARSGDEFTYAGRRRWQGRAASRTRVRVGAAVPHDQQDDLDLFLTARWALFAHGPAGLLRADVDHGRWPLRRAELLDFDDQLVAAAGYDLAGRDPDHVAFSPGVDVRVGLPERA